MDNESIKRMLELLCNEAGFPVRALTLTLIRTRTLILTLTLTLTLLPHVASE